MAQGMCKLVIALVQRRSHPEEGCSLYEEGFPLTYLVVVSLAHYVTGNYPHVGSGSLASGASSARFTL